MTTHRLKLAVLGACTAAMVVSVGVVAANRWRNNADIVGGVATFVGATLFGFAWLFWPRPRDKLPELKFAGRRARPCEGGARR